MEIQAATLTQYQRALNGSWTEIDGDVGNVVKDIQAINKDFRVRASDYESIFAVYQVSGNRETLVTTSTTLDARLVRRIEEVTNPKYNLANELEKLEDEKKAKVDYETSQDVSEKAERLAHALRKDKGFKKNF